MGGVLVRLDVLGGFSEMAATTPKPVSVHQTAIHLDIP
jgi:hypothetical protein